MQNKSYRFFLFFIISSWGVNAQDMSPAFEIFEYMESQYAVNISYIEDDIQGISLPFSAKAATLEDWINAINDHPLLECRKVGEKSIAVRRIYNVVTICGYVIDKENRDLLVGATIKSSSGESYAITDGNGFFKLESVTLESEIHIRYLGYQDKRMMVSALVQEGKTECKIVELEPEYFQLNEIVLSNLFTTGLYKKSDGSIVISKDDFGLLPGLVAPDVLQTIQELPGIESVNESIADINIRGGSNDQNFMSWEGIKMYQTGHFFGLISAFNPQITKNVTVVKNGTSAQYTDGVSGSVLMRTDHHIQKEFNGSVSSDLLAANLILNIPVTAGMSFSIAGRQSYTQWFKSPTYSRYFKRSFEGNTIQNKNFDQDADFRFDDISAKWLYEPHEDHRISLTFIRLYNELSYSEELSEEEDQRRSTLIQQSIGVGGELNSKWSKTLQTDLSAYFSEYHLDASDNHLSNEQSIHQENKVQEAGFKFSILYKITDNLTWLNGYDFKETGVLNASYVVNPTYEIIKKKVNRNHGLYSEITYQSDVNYFRGGIRFNYLETLGKVIVEPRFTYKRNFLSDFSVNIQAELKHQTSTQFVDLNEDFLGVENRRWVNSDESIPVIRSKQLSVGVDYKAGSWYMELTGFYKKANDIISESQGFQGQYQFDNYTGNSNIYGTEFLINKKMNEKSNMWLSYTWCDQSYYFKDLSPERFAGNYYVDHSFSIGESYYFTENWNVSLGYTWKTGRYYTKPEEGNETFYDGAASRVNYGPLNIDRLKNYSRVDISSGFDFHMDHSELSVRVGILNLLNHKNELMRYYIVNPEDDTKAVPVTKDALAITPNFSVIYNF